MKKIIAPLLIAAQVGAANPRGWLSTAKAPFNQDSVAKRMIIEDAVDGRVGIGTVKEAYKIYSKRGKKSDDLERAMWLALLKEPGPLEDYIGQGMGREVEVVYPNSVLKKMWGCVGYGAGWAAVIAMPLFLGWVENQPDGQIIINSNGK